MATRANKMNWMKGFNEEERRNWTPTAAATPTPAPLPQKKQVPVLTDENGEAMENWYDEEAVTPEMWEEDARLKKNMANNRKRGAKNAAKRPTTGNQMMTK